MLAQIAPSVTAHRLNADMYSSLQINHLSHNRERTSAMKVSRTTADSAGASPSRTGRADVDAISLFAGRGVDGLTWRTDDDP
jgi:hypothetical protein